MAKRILLVEDDNELVAVLVDRFTIEGYSVVVSQDGDEAFLKAVTSPFDIILLDVGLPGRNGLDLCRDLRHAGCMSPILILSVRSQTLDKVLALKLGADDYLSKPFEGLELMARIEALMRRAAIPKPAGILRFGWITIDLHGKTVTREGENVRLSAREFRLLQYLLEHAGETCTRPEIMKQVWGHSKEILTQDVLARTVDVYIGNLRHKLEHDPKRPELLLTVPGFGYKWVTPTGHH